MKTFQALGGRTFFLLLGIAILGLAGCATKEPVQRPYSVIQGSGSGVSISAQ